MFAKLLLNGTVFPVLDQAGAFNQLLLSENSSQLLIMNAHKGFLAPKRLCCGVKTAPAIFQRKMDQILSGLEGVFSYIDDILIITQAIDEHVALLGKVLQSLHQ